MKDRDEADDGNDHGAAKPPPAPLEGLRPLPYHPPVQITVNGNPTDVPDETTVRQLIERLGLAGRAVAVELNRELVARKRHEQTALRPDDVVELVTLVGGG